MIKLLILLRFLSKALRFEKKGNSVQKNLYSNTNVDPGVPGPKMGAREEVGYEESPHYRPYRPK